jgi:hypothetical protein
MLSLYCFSFYLAIRLHEAKRRQKKLNIKVMGRSRRRCADHDPYSVLTPTKFQSMNSNMTSKNTKDNYIIDFYSPVIMTMMKSHGILTEEYHSMNDRSWLTAQECGLPYVRQMSEATFINCKAITATTSAYDSQHQTVLI